jgi:hypothetical protein
MGRVRNTNPEDRGVLLLYARKEEAQHKLHRKEEWNLRTNSCRQRARKTGGERKRRGRDADCWLPAGQRAAEMLS